MNILIPHTWLLEHLDTNATPEEIQKLLSLCGPSVERIYEREGDSVYDIEITTNRVDCMSVRGIAREAAVILQQFAKKAKLKPLPNYAQEIRGLITKSSAQLPLPKVINKQKLCQRTLGIVLADVQRSATPEWMAKRLRQIEANVHDAVIDITNYVTHDLGHPCHAFDYDKIMSLGGVIIIKQAAAGKKFMTLDGVEYTTVGGEVVFENNAGVIIDLPGIKGTANTSINDQTKNILFWIEDVEAAKIRFGSMNHAIRTVAAQLNEKNVDPELAKPVLLAGVKMFQDLASAKVASPIFDEFPGRKVLPAVAVKLDRITEYLGVELPLNKIDKILTDLGCAVELKSQKLLVTPPSFRPDMEIPADVIEEIARIYGYHNLPSVVMPTAIPLSKPADVNFALENRIKSFLADIGWQELYTYSMVSEQLALASGFPLSAHLKLQNPLSDDHVYLRRSLVPSLEEIINQNSQRGELSIFEVANIYVPQEKTLPKEKLCATLVSTLPLRIVKGELEALLQQFFIAGLEIAIMERAAAPYTQIAKIKIHSQKKKALTELGTLGILPNQHLAIVLDLQTLIQIAQTHPTYQPALKTSEIIEDLTFVLPERSEVGKVLKSILAVSPLITSGKLKDIFGQNFTFTITYCNPRQNITSAEALPLRQKIVQALQEKYCARLVGQIA